MCTAGDGRIVLSQSFGLAPSHLCAYDGLRLEPAGTFTADGEAVPLYCLDGASLVEDVEAPPMAEGIESHDGRVYVSDESASNKYIFGKLYGAGKVYAIDLEGNAAMKKPRCRSSHPHYSARAAGAGRAAAPIPDNRPIDTSKTPQPRGGAGPRVVYTR